MGEIIILKVDDEDGSVYDKILSVLPKKVKTVTMNPNIVTYGKIKIDANNKNVFLGKQKVKLSSHEFKLLSYLARHPGKVFSKNQIFDAVYNEDEGETTDNIIYCLIRSLRKKLELEPDPQHPKYIHTVRGVGYKFEVVPGE